MPAARPSETETSPPLPGFDIDNPESAETAFQASTQPRQQGARLWVPLTPDGAIDASKVNRKSVEKLKQALSNSREYLNSIGAEPPVAASSTFSDETVGMIVNLQSGLETNLAAKQFKQVPREIIAEVFPYNKDEHKALTEGLQRIIAKYPLLNNIKYKEEMDYIGMSLGLFMQKVMIMRDRLQASGWQPPAPGPTPPPNGKAEATQ